VIASESQTGDRKHARHCCFAQVQDAGATHSKNIKTHRELCEIARSGCKAVGTVHALQLHEHSSGQATTTASTDEFRKQHSEVQCSTDKNWGAWKRTASLVAHDRRVLRTVGAELAWTVATLGEIFTRRQQRAAILAQNLVATPTERYGRAMARSLLHKAARVAHNKVALGALVKAEVRARRGGRGQEVERSRVRERARERERECVCVCVRVCVRVIANV
jgi:hypothetical protein